MGGNDDLPPLLSGELEDDLELTLIELSRVCRLPTEQVIELVEEGVIEPLGRNSAQWRFRGTSVHRVRCAVQLHSDLGINWSGAALALDLLEEIDSLRTRLERYGA